MRISLVSHRFPVSAKPVIDEELSPSGAFVTTTYWFICEISVASICISLPSIFRLVKRGISHGPAALLNDREYPRESSRSRQAKDAIGDDGFLRLTNDTKVSRRERGIRSNDLELESC